MSMARLPIQTGSLPCRGVAAGKWIEVAAHCDPAARVKRSREALILTGRLIALNVQVCSTSSSPCVLHRTARASGAEYDLLRSAARWDACAAGLGKPHELSARDGARIVVGEGARNKARRDRVMDAWRQNVKGRAPVQ
jgi:hypothetical protein